MRKIDYLVLVVAGMVNTSCTSLVGTATSAATSKALGDVLTTVANGNTLSNVLSSVMGTDKLSKEYLVGTWKYSAPGCAFTSEKTLAKAGGEVVAADIKAKLEPEFTKMGITSSNTSMVLNADNTFSAQINGKSLSGKYTYAESDGKLELQGTLLSITCYAKRNGTAGVAFLLESKKLLTLFQTIALLTNNENLTTISEISKNYDGVRLGFDMVK